MREQVNDLRRGSLVCAFKSALFPNREAVQHPSPGSRSAPWVGFTENANPNGVLHLFRGTPLGFFIAMFLTPRVRCATLGFVVQRRWRLCLQRFLSKVWNFRTLLALQAYFRGFQPEFGTVN